MSKVFEALVSVLLGRFMERSGVLPPTSMLIRTFWALVMHVLCPSHTLQSALESRKWARIVHIAFSATFDRVNRKEILYKLCSVGIGGCLLSIMTEFLSNPSQHVMVYVCRRVLLH